LQAAAVKALSLVLAEECSAFEFLREPYALVEDVAGDL